MNSEPERAKLEVLSEQIRKASGTKPTVESLEKSPAKLSNLGFDFMGAVLGGALLGWILDKSIPVLAPWALIVCIFLGFAGGILNVWRGLQEPKPAGTPQDKTKTN